MKPWKLLDSEYLVDAPWLKVAKETCELPNGKVIDDFYTLWQPDWVLILARTTEGKWVMTEQYRHGTGKIALEFPAGIIDKGETPEQAAEALEAGASLIEVRDGLVRQGPNFVSNIQKYLLNLAKNERNSSKQDSPAAQE